MKDEMRVGRRQQRPRRRTALLLLAFGFVACGGPRSEPTSRTPMPPTTAPTKPPTLDEGMEARLREQEKLRDPRGTYADTLQTRARAYRPIAPSGRFPAASVARATIVTFRHGSDKDGPCRPESEPLRADGTFCSDVRTGHTDLTEEERRSVLALPALVMAADPKAPRPTTLSTAVTRCDFDPHHGIVFFDDQGLPVARIVVCLSCGEWIVAPGSDVTGGAIPTVMPKEARALFVRIADAHGLAPWMFDDAQQQALQTYVRNTYGTDEDPTDLGRERRRKAPRIGQRTPSRSLAPRLRRQRPGAPLRLDERRGSARRRPPGPGSRTLWVRLPRRNHLVRQAPGIRLQGPPPRLRRVGGGARSVPHGVSRT